MQGSRGYPGGAASSTGLINGKITAQEPSYADCFYNTTNQQHTGTWHDGTPGSSVSQDVPKISDILAARARVRKPVGPMKTVAKCVLANAIKADEEAHMADKVLSADIRPKQFPAKADDIQYLGEVKRGAQNPLYACSQQAIGKEAPLAHQLPDRYFPSGNKFTKSFVDLRPRFSGLSTKPNPSNVHSELDQYY